MDRRQQLVIAAAALLLAPGAFAQTYQVGQYLGNLNDAGRFAYNTMGGAAQHATYSPGATWSTANGAARIAGSATATIGGRTVPLTLISRVPLPAIVNGMRAVASMNPTVAAVTLLGAFAMDHWLEQSKVDWNRDPATNITYPFVILKETPQCNMASVNQAAYAQWIASEQSPPGTQCPRSVNALTIQGPATTKNGVSVPSGQCAVGAQWTSFTMSNGTCVPLYTDGYSAYQNVPSALVPSDREPATWDQVEPRLQSGNYDAVDWKGVTEKLLRAGGSVNPSQITSTVSGPASQQGQRTERTLSNGDKQVTQVTHNYTYNNSNGSSSVTHNTTTTNITTNINNEVVNEETETTDNPTPDKPDPPDLCEKNPDILACQKLKLGELEAKPVPNEDRPLAITPDSGWTQGAGTCPQPKTVTFMGTQLSFEYTLFCDFAVAIKPLFIGFAWLSATLTFFGLARRD